MTGSGIWEVRWVDDATAKLLSAFSGMCAALSAKDPRAVGTSQAMMDWRLSVGTRLEGMVAEGRGWRGAGKEAEASSERNEGAIADRKRSD